MISIIVPVYNVEKQIGRCIESVKMQSFSDWELILVDDGSPDLSGRICDDFARNDSRIRVFHKVNGGASSARNVGIENACGDWIVFVDADDTISSDFLKMVAQTQDYDLLIFGMAVDAYFPDGRLAHSSSKLLPMEYAADINKMHHDFACIFRSLNMDSSCAKAYRKTVIDKAQLRFNTQMICFEDFDFVIRYMARCKGKYLSLPYIAYHYLQDTDYNPILRRNGADLAPSIYILLDDLYAWLKPEVLDPDSRHAYFYLIAQKFSLIIDQLKGKCLSKVFNGLRGISRNDFFKTYRRDIISHSPFFKRYTLKYNISGLRIFAYLILKFGK